MKKSDIYVFQAFKTEELALRAALNAIDEIKLAKLFPVDPIKTYR